MWPHRSFWSRDLPLLLTLLVLAGGLKYWLVSRTEVIARDGIGYVRFAARLDHEPWSQVLREVQQHPLYPVNVLFWHRLFQSWSSDDGAATWQLSAQTANAAASLLLVFPMFFLARELFDRQVAFWATAFFQCLPSSARITSDALSEGTYLLFAVSALCFAVLALRKQGYAYFVLCGIAGGLAYLTRPEGALVVALAGLALIAVRFLRISELPWRLVLQQGTGLAAGALVIAAPYCITIGGISVKPASQQMLKPGVAATVAPSVDLLLAARFMPGTDGEENASVSVVRGLEEVLKEVGKGFNYVLWVPLLIGILFLPRWRQAHPGLLLLVLVVAANFFVLWRLAIRAQYVSERHALLLIACSCILACGVLFSVQPSWRFAQSPIAARILTLALVSFLAWNVVQSRKPLHQHRLGHKLAGEWLAGQMQPGDRIVDPYGWVTFYAMQREDVMPDAKISARKSKRYLVVELGEKDVTRLRRIQDSQAEMVQVETAFAWPSPAQPEMILLAASERRR